MQSFEIQKKILNPCKPIKTDQLYNPRVFKLSENSDKTEIALEYEKEKIELLPKISWYSDRFNIIILFMLYICTGLIIGFQDASLPMILAKENASYSALATLTLADYPYTLKFIIAPICDSYYLKKWNLGKRKTYIVIPFYLITICLLVSSFYIEMWILAKEIIILTSIGFFLEGLLAIQSIGTDAWSLNILHPDNIAFASLALNLGQDLGNIISFNLFVWLNLRDEGSIIDSRELFLFISFFFIITTLITHFGKKETENEIESSESLCHVLKEMKGFFLNKNLRFLVLVFLITEFPFGCIDYCTQAVLIKKGFSTDLINSTDLFSLVIGFVGYGIGTYYANKKLEWSSFMFCMFIRFLNNLFMFSIVNCYDTDNETLINILYIIQKTISSINFSVYGLCTYSFILRIADENFGASFITFLCCVSNFGPISTATISLWMLDYLNFNNLCYLQWGLGLIIFCFWGRKIIEMEKKDKKMFELDYID